MFNFVNLVPRPCPAFRSGKAGRAWFLFSCEMMYRKMAKHFQNIQATFYVLFN